MGCLVAKWLKYWTADLRGPRFWPHWQQKIFSSGHTQQIEEKGFTFVSFRGDIKLSVPGYLGVAAVLLSCIVSTGQPSP